MADCGASHLSGRRLANADNSDAPEQDWSEEMADSVSISVSILVSMRGESACRGATIALSCAEIGSAWGIPGALTVKFSKDIATVGR